MSRRVDNRVKGIAPITRNNMQGINWFPPRRSSNLWSIMRIGVFSDCNGPVESPRPLRLTVTKDHRLSRDWCASVSKLHARVSHSLPGLNPGSSEVDRQTRANTPSDARLIRAGHRHASTWRLCRPCRFLSAVFSRFFYCFRAAASGQIRALVGIDIMRRRTRS